MKEYSDFKNRYSEDDISKMLEFLVDNIFVVFAGKVFKQTVGIPMGTNSAPRLADIFLKTYEAEFIQSLLSTGRKQLATWFKITYRYIDHVLSINKPLFEAYLGLGLCLFLLNLKSSTPQRDTSIYDNRDNFNFHVTNLPFLRSNIPFSPLYCVFISRLIRYARACSSYEF